MLTVEQRFLIISQLRRGQTVPEIHSAYPEICRITTLYRIAQEFGAGVEVKPVRKKRQPWRKTDPKTAATIIRRLTVAKTDHGIRSVARDFNISHTAVRKLLKKKGIKC